MILYHFCADRHVKNILGKGLTIGGVMEITPKGYALHTGWNWLTLNGNPNEQTWEGRVLIPYSRTAWRLTINIPDEALGNVYDKERLIALYPGVEYLFSGHTESSEWRVYRGMIPNEWIKAADDMRKEEKE